MSAAGDGLDHEALAASVYEDLRRIAVRLFRHESPEITLQPTAVVHEAYLRLASGPGSPWNDRVHFVATAARAMRRVLVDAARSRGREKRGSGLERVTLVDPEAGGERSQVDLLALEEALERLGEVSERYVRIVELRFFGGLTVEEVAALLGISDRMVRHEWSKARAWLMTFLEEEA